MRQDRSDFYYAQPNKTPVQLRWCGQSLLIDCCLCFNARAKTTHPPDSPGQSYADLVCEGIIQHWSGCYELGTAENPDPVNVRVIVHRQPLRRAVRIRLKPQGLMPAHVISPLYRRFWGIFLTGQLESMGLNWSLTQPGRIIMPACGTAVMVRDVAAHEMGHVLGIGDAYAAIYRFYSAAPGTQAFMMHSNSRVQPEEIRMLLLAHRSGRMQYFPKSWDTARFLAGLKSEIRRLARQIRTDKKP